MATVARAKTQTLSANTATDDSISDSHTGIEVINHTASTVVYVSIGATAPTVAGDNFIPVLGGTSRVFGARGIGGGGTTRVRLISSGTPTVTIVGVGT
jgi:hypothetical protein